MLQPDFVVNKSVEAIQIVQELLLLNIWWYCWNYVVSSDENGNFFLSQTLAAAKSPQLGLVFL
jgi:hypothetical protein